MRFALLALVFGIACQPTESSVEGVEATIEAAPAAQPAEADPLGRYANAVCRLYVEKPCIESQKSTCPTHLAFEDMGSCERFLRGTAADCTRDPQQVLASIAPKLDACEAELRTFTCGEAPFCSDAGKIDAVGACADVAAAIADACPFDDEAFDG